MQSGAGFQEVSDAVNVYDIFQDTNTINDSLRHTLIPLYPENYGQNITAVNGENTEYTFNIPTGIAYTDEVFYTADAYITVNGVRKPPYNVATAATKVAIQNNANSLWTRCETTHNGNVAEVVMEPGKVALISHLNESEPENRMFGPSDYTWLPRAKVFDTAGAAQNALTGTGALALGTGVTTTIATNAIKFNFTGADGAKPFAEVITHTDTGTIAENTDFDESFAERCKRTTSITAAGGTDHEFQITGKLPLGLFRGRRGVATYLHKTQVKLYRNTDAKILENRSSLAATIVLTNLTLWVPILKPSLDILSNIQEGISGKKDDNGNIIVKPQKQKIAFQHIDYTTIAIPATSPYFTNSYTLSGNPAAVIIGFQIAADINKRGWNHEDIRSVNLSLNGMPIPENPIVVSDWTNKKDAKRLYELFLMTFGQHQGMPAISYEQFTENYCLWCFDTSTSITGMLELNKKSTQMEIRVEFISGSATAAMAMEVFTVRDKLYTIEGPNDQFAEVF